MSLAENTLEGVKAPSKVVAFITAHAVSWVIEIAILSVIAFITIGEVKKTNEQTREMLTAVSQFVGERQEAVGDAIDSIANEAQNIDIGGKVDVSQSIPGSRKR